MSFAILGPGAVGSFVAAALTRSGEATMVVARPQTAGVLTQTGLTVESNLLGSFSARPPAITELPVAVDVLIVTTKAPALERALDEHVKAPPRLVVPLLNGIEHLALLRERFGSRVVAATIRIDARRPAVGHVVQHGSNLLIEVARAPGLATVFDRAGIPSRSLESDADVMWRKLVRLCPLALTTTAFDRTLGEIRDDPSQRSQLEQCVREACAVARAEGAAIDDAAPLAELEEMHPTLASSLQRDVRAGVPSELDAIGGAVLRAGARHGLECPTIAGLVEMIGPC